MNARMQNLLSKMVEAGANLQDTVNAIRGIIEKSAPPVRAKEKRQAWIKANVAEPLAAVYNTKLRLSGEAMISAYVSNRGTIAFKNEKGRDNNAQACNMAFRKLVTQESTRTEDPLRKVKALVKAYQKLSAQERKVFRLEAGLTAA